MTAMNKLFSFVAGLPPDSPAQHTIKALCDRLGNENVHFYDRRDAILELREKATANMAVCIHLLQFSYILMMIPGSW